jgi:hypothetical protein
MSTKSEYNNTNNSLSLSLSLLTFSPSRRSRSLKKLLAHVSQMTKSCRPHTPHVGSNRVEGEVPLVGSLRGSRRYLCFQGHVLCHSVDGRNKYILYIYIYERCRRARVVMKMGRWRKHPSGSPTTCMVMKFKIVK